MVSNRKFNPTDLALKTTDAYSFSAFGETEWLKACQMLAERRFTARDAEIILRSKLTRWCRDAYSTADEGNAEYLERFLNEQHNVYQGLGLRGKEHR